MKRGGTLPQQSDTRIGERQRRREVVDAAIERAGGRCELWWLGGCDAWGQHLVGHEVAHRSVMPGSHLVDDLVVALCPAHNGWEDVQTNTVAVAHGVRAPAWAVDRYGAAAVGAECRRIRQARARGVDPGPAGWTLDDWTPPPPTPPWSLTVAGRVSTVRRGSPGVVPGALCTPADAHDMPDPF